MTGLAILLILVGMAVFAPIVARGQDPLKQDLVNTLASPSAAHWLGTDQLGRDVWSRLVYGARIDLRVGFLAVMFPFILGTTLGQHRRVLRRAGWTPA